MKLVTYRAHVEAAATLGVLVENRIVDVARLGEAFGEDLPDTMLGLIDAGPDALHLLGGMIEDCGGHYPLHCATHAANVTLLAPIPRPRKNIFGIGLNYAAHIGESSRGLDTSKEVPKQPVIFSKPPTCVIGPGDAIRHNGAITAQLDWEVELAAIIGTTARRVAKADALAHVFGYAVMIDVSARDNRRAGQWIYSKGMDSYAPFGPCIVTADEIPDPQALDLWLTVNGVEKQRSNTAKMLFRVDDLVSDISQGITLEPGDIIATGTPEGVGAGRDPQEWLRPGDTVVACVEGIGTLRHPVIDATDA
ncbi:MAG: fumarylacetoacetate hydrolase family protein [Gemmobacter sp.]